MPTIDVNARSGKEALDSVRKMESITKVFVPEYAIPIRYRVTFHTKEKKLKRKKKGG